MSTHATDKRNTLYANLLDEVKVRIGCIEHAARDNIGFPAPIAREFCYLQLRFLCELIALACLVAHGDMKSLQSHKVGKSWSADDILDRLTELRPHFYPSPVTQKRTGPGTWEMHGVDPSPLPKEELLRLYGLTHKYLHRGTLKKLLSSDRPIETEINVPEIIKWAQKILDLLSLHVIAIDSDNVIIGMLRNAENNNKVQVSTAGRPPDWKPVEP